MFSSSILLKKFVASGDYLVFKCPTWSWSSGDESKLKSWLPADKQFIVTKNGKQLLVKLNFLMFFSACDSE